MVQNCLKAALKTHITDGNAFLCVKNLVASFRRSDATGTLYRTVGITLHNPSETRWGYWIDIIGSFLKHKREIRSIALSKGFRFPTEHQIEFLQQVYELISIFGEVLQEMQREDATVSKVFFHIKCLQTQLNSKEETAVGNIRNVIHAFRSDMNTRFACALNEAAENFDPCFLVATAIDPNTAYALNETERNKAAEYVYAMVQKFGDVPNATEVSAPESSSQPVKPLSQLEQLAAKLRASSTQPARAVDIGRNFRITVAKCLQMVAGSAPAE